MEKPIILKIIKVDNRPIAGFDGLIRYYAWIFDGRFLMRVPVFCTCSQLGCDDHFEEELTKEENET